MYGYPAGGYVMTQSAGGVPVAVPMQAMQAGAGGAAAQGYHQPMVLVPVSGTAGGQQLIAQATSPGGIITGTLQQQQLETGMPHSFVDGGYAPKACNGQVCLMLLIVRWKMRAGNLSDLASGEERKRNVQNTLKFSG